MWRAELKGSVVITGGGDEEEWQDIINELIALEIELNEGARKHFRVQCRPIDMRVRFDLTDTETRVRVFSNPKFKYIEVEPTPKHNPGRRKEDKIA
jgi:hypothetical protein